MRRKREGGVEWGGVKEIFSKKMHTQKIPPLCDEEVQRARVAGRVGWGWEDFEMSAHRNFIIRLDLLFLCAIRLNRQRQSTAKTLPLII